MYKLEMYVPQSHLNSFWRNLDETLWEKFLWYKVMISLPVAKSLYNFTEIDITEIGDYPEGIKDICDRQIDGLIVENFLSQEDVSKVVSQLTPQEPSPDSPFGNVLVYGSPLCVANDLTKYSEKAVDFSQYCRQIFSGGVDFETRLVEVLGAMSGGRSVELPNTPDGSPYTPGTMRVLEPGQTIGWHFENMFFEASGYQDLSTIIEPEGHLAYILVLSAADAGGEIILYDVEWSETKWAEGKPGEMNRNALVEGKPITSVMKERDKMPISPKAGSLIVFDGGKILHSVSAVQGSRRRITLSGFLAFSHHREKVYYWG